MKKNVLCIFAIVLFLLLLALLFLAKDSSEILRIGDTFSIQGDSGQLNVSIVGAQIHTHIPNIVEDDYFFLDNSYITVKNGVSNQVYGYPDFLLNNGHLVDGVYLVVIDIKLTNENAESSLYENPYEFRGDSIVTLVNLDDRDGNNFRYRNAVFYYGLNRGTNHPTAFELKPGETIIFSVGFLIDEQWVNAANHLFASTGANTKSTLVNLALGGETREE